MYKIETTSKVSQKLTRKINLGRQGARAELSTLDTAPKLLHSPERAKTDMIPLQIWDSAPHPKPSIPGALPRPRDHPPADAWC